MIQISEFDRWSGPELDFSCLFERQGYRTHYRIVPLRWAFPSSDKWSELEVRRIFAQRAHEDIQSLSESFKRANHGKFIAVSYAGDVEALADTLPELKTRLNEKGIRGNVHIERIGYRSLAKLSR